ncbi:MAG: DNA gyrase subunit A [Chromatiales bacterium]|jgi:DNA gyrase subunit A|nr:DNA gyrase subunit A [Chromatiales bacterium]
MSEFAQEVLTINIEEEMKQSYLDYAMSVIVGRALPDVRDGLKPVHRRVLFAMNVLRNDWNRPYLKSARVVGDVIGKYHPHGDSAVYDALVRMAQQFSMRAMLIDGQGNFGSVDGDSAAAMRYTEVRMARIAHEMLADLDKETVDFVPNYSDSEFEPSVLPAKVPNLLVNGASGIAVGMATNIPPHNLGEVVGACIAFVDNPHIDIEGLMEFIPGPDFPTAAIINGAEGIREAYHTGRGRIYMRARSHFEQMDSGRERIVITELPYQVNKARLQERIAELVKERKIEGITEIRDESDKGGMRVVIELRRNEVPDVILNHLFQQTQLQTVFGINIVALMDGQPRILNLKQVIEAFVRHRREVVTRRTLYDLRKARERAHELEGLAVALASIDEIIELIKASASPSEARAGLLAKPWPPGAVSGLLASAGASATRPDELEDQFGLHDDGYHLSERQAQAILNLRLHRLTGLEQEKIVADYNELLETVRDLLDIVGSPARLMSEIRLELEALRDSFADERRTEIWHQFRGFNRQDLVTPEDVVVTLSHEGYVKAQSLDQYRAQRRGGRGKTATRTKAEDFVARLFIAHTHDTMLCFSSLGKLYWLKVYDLPQANRTARGTPIVNLLNLSENERIHAILPVKDFAGGGYVFMVSARGTVKKTLLSDFSRPRSAGIIAVDLVDGDELVGVAMTDGSREVMLFSDGGKVIRFPESNVRPMGRVSRGVRGMELADGERITSLIIAETGMVLTATENGYGKNTVLDDYRTQRRGGKGLISIQKSERNGQVVGALQVDASDQIMLISDGGTLVRTRVDEVSVLGRNTQGVRLIRMDEGERLVGIVRVAESDAPADDGDDDLSDGAGEAGQNDPAIGPIVADSGPGDATGPGDADSGDTTDDAESGADGDC